MIPPEAPTAEDPLRKAAVFVRSLPPDAAATLIDRLSADEAAALRASIASLGEVDNEEQDGVAAALRDAATVASEEQADGVELSIGPQAAKIAEAVGADRDDIADDAPGDTDDPFGLLRDADSAAIATYLAGEAPRAVALVLSFLPAETASAILETYADDTQADLLALMARLGEADPASVKIIADDLAAWVRRQTDQRRLREDRIASVRSVLGVSTPERRRRLAERLAATDPLAAEALGLKPEPREPSPEPASPTASLSEQPASDSAVESPPALRFEDLERVDGALLVRALGQVGSRAAVLALAEASDPLLRRVESGLSKQATRLMRRRLNEIGQTTLREVEAARNAFTAAVERLIVARRVRRVAAMN